MEPSHGACKEETIDSRIRFWTIPWGELFRYRSLLWVLVSRDFEIKYRILKLWPLWLVLQPFLFSSVLALIFGRFVGVHTEGISAILFYLCGFIVWNYFSHSVQAVSRTFSASRQLFSKIYFPRLLVPVSAIAFNVIELCFPLTLLLISCAWFSGSSPNASPLWSPRLAAILWFLLEAGALALGAGLWIAALSARLRDAQFAAGFLLQLGMFLSPVIYPLSIVPDQWRGLLQLNPMTEVLEGMRWALFGTPSFAPAPQIIAAGTTLVILWTGIAAFQWAEHIFMEEE